MKVKDVMTPNVERIPPDASLRDAARIMKECQVGALPVYEGDRLIGMVTDRDIALRGLADGHDVESLTARDVMSSPIVYCRTDEDIGDAIRIMEDKAIRRLPVIDGNKRMVGMLALGDIGDCAPRDMSAEVMQAVSAHHA